MPNNPKKDGRQNIPLSTVRRLPMYLRLLYRLDELGRERVSSEMLAHLFGGTASQIRQDLRYFGPLGTSRNGYSVQKLIGVCEKGLCLVGGTSCIVVGIGNLGRALALYAGFQEKEFAIKALFDNDPAVIGSRVGNNIVQPSSAIGKVVQKEGIRLAFLTVPASAAQDVANNLVAVGIEGILNFAPVQLMVPDFVVVEDVQMLNSLMVLNYLVHEKRRYRKKT